MGGERQGDTEDRIVESVPMRKASQDNSTDARAGMTRRRFLSRAAGFGAGAVGFAHVVSSAALGKAGSVAPSNRIAMGFVGTGGMGSGHLRGFINEPDVQVVAVCDVDSQHRDRVRNFAELGKESGYNDFRELLERNDIDAVLVATPDHWHVPVSLAAIRAGKDVYCEKPLTLTVEQGRVLSDAAGRYKRVFQTGSQQRSNSRFPFACALATDGSIGELKTINVGLPPSRSSGPQPVMAVPEGFDYDMWLGPAPWRPYTKLRCHGKFRHNFDYSGGKFIDWGAHHLDIVQMALGADDSGPVEISAWGEFPTEGIYNTAVAYDIEYTYACGVKVRAWPGGPNGIRFEGTKGWVQVNRGSIDAHSKSLLKSGRMQRYHRKNHRRDFLDCIKLRKTAIATAEIGHRSATVCHLGNIAMRLGRKLKWDPVKELFVGDTDANRMLSQPMRSPWHL